MHPTERESIQMMSPSLDLNQMDIHSLDGSPSAEKAREEIDDILK